MTLRLTARQEQLWRFIKSCDRSPSTVEMREAIGVKSNSGTNRLVMALKKRGYVDYQPYQARTIVALDPPPPGLGVVIVQLRGRIS